MNNPNKKTPSNREFIKNLRKYKEITDVWIDGSTKLGIKNLDIS